MTLCQQWCISNMGGENFFANSEVSKNQVLWADIFKEKERIFLRQYLEDKKVSYCSRDTYEIAVRMAWNPKHKSEIEKCGRTIDGRLVVCLHGYSGKCKTSWAWAKLMRPLWKRGFTICCVDMPCSGRTAVNNSWNVDFDHWLSADAEIIGKVIAALGFTSRVSFVAYREACGTVARVWQQFPHIAAPANIFVDPIITLDDLLPVEAPYGAQMDWYKEMKTKQALDFYRLITKIDVRIWACFTNDKACTKTGRETMQALLAVVRERRTLEVSELSKEFICEATAGAGIPATLLVPCKYIRDKFTAYIDGKFDPPARIPSDALNVASTVASTSVPTLHGSKFAPSVMEASDEAYYSAGSGLAALATVTEAAEVLSRGPSRHGERPTSAASSQDGGGARTNRGRVSKRHFGLQMRGKPSLPLLMNSTSSGSPKQERGSTMRRTLSKLTKFAENPEVTLQSFRDESRGKARGSIVQVQGDDGSIFRYRGGESRASKESLASIASATGLPEAREDEQPSLVSRGKPRGHLPSVEKPRPHEATKTNIMRCANIAASRRLEDPNQVRLRALGNSKYVQQHAREQNERAAKTGSSVKEIMNQIRDRL